MSSPAEIGEIENLVWKLIESGLSYIFSLLKTYFSLDCGWKTDGKPVLPSLGFPSVPVPTVQLVSLPKCVRKIVKMLPQDVVLPQHDLRNLLALAKFCSIQMKV